MTGHTKNRIALLATIQERPCDRERQGVNRLALYYAREEMGICLELPPSHRARHQRPNCTPVREGRTGFEVLVARLVVHVLTTSSDEAQTQQDTRHQAPP